ncbi:phage late gene regulator [Escherichia coli]|nr:phage late gene regulator [Escherichia coli]
MLDALTFNAGSTLTPDYMLMLDSRDITGNISDRLMRPWYAKGNLPLMRLNTGARRMWSPSAPGV